MDTKTHCWILRNGFRPELSHPLTSLAGTTVATIRIPMTDFSMFTPERTAGSTVSVKWIAGIMPLSQSNILKNTFLNKRIYLFIFSSRFYDSYCGMINGSFSEGWAPRRNRSTISLFISDLCRTVTLDYEGDVLNAGVSSYRFVGTQRVFANGSDPYPETGCFCSGGVCNPSGVGNSSTCKYNLPMFVSFPHYYLADPYYSDMVEGMTPKEDIHKFHIDLEPVRPYFKSIFTFRNLKFLFYYFK